MATEREVAVVLDRDTALQGRLAVPGGAVGVVVLTEGSGEGQQAAGCSPLVLPLLEAGLATLRLDLLTAQEESRRQARDLCFNVGLLAVRLARAALWLHRQPETCELPVALMGVGAGADAALMAVAVQPRGVAAAVAALGRSRFALEYLRRVRVPTLLLVRGEDARPLRPYRDVLQRPRGRVRLDVLHRARSGPDALAQVADRAGPWLVESLAEEGTVRAAAPAP